jgi:hypothetical protein
MQTAEYRILADSIDENHATLDQEGVYSRGEYFRFIKKNADAKDEELLFEE